MSLPGTDYSARQVREQTLGIVADRTGERAVEAANISMKIEAIESALLQIPEKYREGIRQKLMMGVPYGDMYHHNTWKKWQQIYIFHVAKNLGLY